MFKIFQLPYYSLLREIIANAVFLIPAIREAKIQSGRTSYPVDKEAHKILAQFNFFMDTIKHVKDRTVVEIGPGDAIGLAPLFITAGASQYVAFDRFLGPIFDEKAQTLYRELEKHAGTFSDNWQHKAILHNKSMEDGCEITNYADVIISFNSLEHLHDIDAALRNMAKLLKPEGIMIHRVDYGPHDVWRKTSNPFMFRRVPRLLWWAMGSNRGYPNRVPHADVLKLFKANGLKVVDRVTHSFAGEPLDAEIFCSHVVDVSPGAAFVE